MHYNLYINGSFVESASKDVLHVENPATGEEIATVSAAHKEDVDRAVAGAKKALASWSTTEPKERLAYVRAMAHHLREEEETIAKTIATELGAPLSFARTRHTRTYLDNIDDYLSIAEDYPYVEHHEGFEVHKKPVGVVGALTPWNYPFGQIVKKVIPALLAGCTVVLKPSQRTPLTAYAFVRAAEAAKLPAGVFQLLPGRGSQVGNALAEHEDVAMISFTGSTSGGREVARLALSTIKRTALELGGKSAAVLLPNYDEKEKALKAVLDTVYLNTGQTCSAKTRLIAPRREKEEIEDLLVSLTKGYVFGDPMDPATDVGPLQSLSQFEKVRDYIALGKEEATLLYESEPIAAEGYYQGPVIFTDVEPKARIAQEEIFGPVLSVLYYDTVEEAITLANDSIYGLSGMVFGDENTAKEVALAIRTGQVQINDHPFTQNAPFGGMKSSGYGREGSVHGFEEFLELQTLFI